MSALSLGRTKILLRLSLEPDIGMELLMMVKKMKIGREGQIIKYIALQAITLSTTPNVWHANG